MYSKTTSLAAVAGLFPLISAYCDTGRPFRNDSSYPFTMNGTSLPVSAGVVCTQDNVATSGICSNGTIPQCSIPGSLNNVVKVTGLANLSGASAQSKAAGADFVEFLVGKVPETSDGSKLSYTQEETLGMPVVSPPDQGEGTPTLCIPVGSSGHIDFIPTLTCWNGSMVECSSDMGIPEGSHATICGIDTGVVHDRFFYGFFNVNMTTAAEARNLSSNPSSPENQNGASTLGWSVMIAVPMFAAALAQVMS